MAKLQLKFNQIEGVCWTGTVKSAQAIETFIGSFNSVHIDEKGLTWYDSCLPRHMKFGDWLIRDPLFNQLHIITPERFSGLFDLVPTSASDDVSSTAPRTTTQMPGLPGI